MKDDKALIIRLINEDLRIHHLMLSLDNLGVEVDDLYRPNILSLIQDLFDIPYGKSPDQFGEIYSNFMDRSLEFNTSGQANQYMDLAKACYEALFTVKKKYFG